MADMNRKREKISKNKRKYNYNSSSESSTSTSSSDEGRAEEIFKLKKRIRQLRKSPGRRRHKIRRRYDSSSSPSDSTREMEDLDSGTMDKENKDPLEVEFVDVDELDRDTLNVLGKNSEAVSVVGEPIQKDIASQWTTDITSGLDQEMRDKLLKKYSIPNNLTMAQPPNLNPEIKAAVTEISLNRDRRLEKVQAQMGISLSALGKAQTVLLGIQKEEGGEKLLQVIEAVNDAARLLADIYHEQSLARQQLVSVSLDRNVRELLQNIPLDGWLFGDNLSERFKAAKAIERTGQELKVQHKPSTSKFKQKISPKNSKAPTRQAWVSGGKKQEQYQSSSRVRASFRTRPTHQSRYNQRKPERNSRRYHY